MATYRIVRQRGRTFLFAEECDVSSHIEINTALVSPDEVLALMQTNHVAPEHLSCVYDDLIFEKNMV